MTDDLDPQEPRGHSPDDQGGAVPPSEASAHPPHGGEDVGGNVYEPGASVPLRRLPLFGPGEAGMPPWVPRLLLQIFGLVVLFFVGYAMVRELRGFLILLLLAFFLSVGLEPAVGYLYKRGWRRGPATGVIMFLAFFAAAVFVVSMIPLVIDQTERLVQRVPAYVDQITSFLDGFGIEFSGERILEATGSLDASLENLAGRAFGVGSAVVGGVFQVFTLLLFTYYFTADGPRLRRSVLSVMRPERQREVLRILEIAIEKTGGYFYSRALLAVLASAVTWAALRFIGVPFALPLALWVGIITQFIPIVGTYVGGILPAFIGLLESPGKALAVVVFIVLYQQFENYVIGPKITQRTMQLHPAVAFGATIAGGTLLGAAGAVIALPVAASVQAVISTYLERHELVESPLLLGRDAEGQTSIEWRWPGRFGGPGRSP